MHSYLFFNFVPGANISMCTFGKAPKLQKLSFVTPEKQIKKKKVNEEKNATAPPCCHLFVRWIIAEDPLKELQLGKL